MPTIDNQGQELYFEDRGTGPCVVLGHSFLCNGEMWAGQEPRLAERFRVVNIDLRGHGRSGPVTTDSTIYDLVGDVLAVLDHLGIERAVWAGLSVGGMVALRAALTAPERVAGLVLMDTHAGSETLAKKIRYRALGLGARLLGFRPLLPAVIPLMFGATTRRGRPDLVRHWEEVFATLHVPSILRLLAVLVQRDSVVDRLGEIDVPTLVMVGEEDRALPPPCSQEIVAGLGRSGQGPAPAAAAELIRVPAAGHLVALEQPEIVTGAMLEFLDGVYDSAG